MLGFTVYRYIKKPITVKATLGITLKGNKTDMIARLDAPGCVGEQGIHKIGLVFY